LRTEGEVTLLLVAGELDLSTLEPLEEALAGHLERHGGRLVVDLTACSFIDSSGIRVLISTSRELDGRGVSGTPMTLVATPGTQVARVLELVGIAEMIPVVETPDEALRD
jgi:anti-sigma B factor antagonist